MKKKKGRKRPKKILKNYKAVSFLILIFAFIGILIFFAPKKPSLPQVQRRNYTVEECNQVNFEIEKVSCENKILKVWIKNVGNVELQGDFLAIVYTPNLQAFLGGAAEKIIKPNERAVVFFDFGKSDVIKRMEIVFQPCPFSTKVLENLNFQC